MSDQWKEIESHSNMKSDSVEFQAPSTPQPTPNNLAGTPAFDFIMEVEKALNNHDWRTLTHYTADGRVNYFGRSHTSNDYIRRDMEQDARTYSSSHCTVYKNTFIHEVSNEYSPRWNGPMIYDEVNVYSEIQERGGRMHKANCRLTVGYTDPNGTPIIYALVWKVL